MVMFTEFQTVPSSGLRSAAGVARCSSICSNVAWCHVSGQGLRASRGCQLGELQQ